MRRYRTWTVFSVALCSLLVLMFVPGITAIRRTEEIYRDVRQIQDNYERNQQLLDAFASNLYLTSITIREFLLDTSAANDREYVKQALDRRASLQTQIQDLRGTVYSGQAGRVQGLEEQVEAYWRTVLPVFRWTPRQRAERGTYFLRQEQRPRRQSMLAITEEIGRLNTHFYRSQYEAINASQQQFRRDIGRVMWFAFLAGLLVSAASILRIAWLEKRAHEQQKQTERTGEELRMLSTRLRHVQEEERKEIARELHDEVGQNLTTLRMELGTLERLRFDKEGQFRDHMAEVKELAEQSLRTIRDIAAGLRPSMLDDLGLVPALQRDARQFSRRTGTRVNVEVQGNLDGLPDRHRTYIYRIVQESLTNCAKHAQPKNIRIGLQAAGGELLLRIEDDGVGMDPKRAANGGLGLIGIQERVRELGGAVAVTSQPGKGMRLDVKILWPQEAHEEDTRAARG